MMYAMLRSAYFLIAGQIALDITIFLSNTISDMMLSHIYVIIGYA